MTPSPRIAKFMQGFETCRLHAYLPTPNDNPTVGWGATGPHITMSTVWTQAQADQNFAGRLALLGARMTGVLLKVPTTQDQFDAMCSLADNIGWANFLGCAVLTNHKAGHYSTAAFAFTLWDKQRDGHGQLVALAGLTRRRAAEAAIYKGS